ncbi:MAG: Ig-like domain-containing protein [bacterium]
MRFIFLYSILLALSGCASQRAPSGGPVDKTPPTIVHVTPGKNATLIPRDQIVEFEFSESMNRKTLEKALFITPDPADRVKFKWKKRKLRIHFLDSLRTDRTYVITLGTGLKDLRGNALRSSYTLAFSTGEELSDGKVSGQVYTEEKAQGILIWAYILEGRSDPDPTVTPADYITQTDTQGKYELTNLSYGAYRLFAVDDKDNNRFFEAGLDGLGLAARDVELSKESLSVKNVNFRVALKDTIGPALISVTSDDRFHLRFIFDENLSADSVTDASNYVILPEKRGTDTLKVELAYLNALNPQEVVLVTEAQNPKTDYQVEVLNIKDLSLNIVDPGFNTEKFVASVIPDTIRPKILKHTPQDSARAVALSSDPELHFSEAMSRDRFERHFQLTDSLGQNVIGTLSWENPAFFRFTPTASLRSLMRYVVTIQSDSVKDLFGNSLADSSFTFTFTSLDKDTLSSISGVIADEDSISQGALYIKAFQASRTSIYYEIQLAEPGPYEFADILPGNYTIEVFQDRDGNGRYSYGQAKPFLPSERFYIYSDEIKVRSRWPNVGNDFVLPK